MDEIFVLRPQPPIRALVIASVAAVVGALGLVGATAFGWPAGIRVLGMIILGLAVILAVVALVQTSRLRSEVTVSDRGYRVRGLGRDQSGVWADVANVSLSSDKLILIGTGDEPSSTVLPLLRGASDPVVVQLSKAIAARLDTQRGYRSVD